MREDSQKSAAIIRERIGDARVDVGLVLSAGLAGITGHVASPVAFKYDDLPGFVRPRFGAADAEYVVGTLGSAHIAVLKGRAHYHETGDIAAMRVPLETLKLLGAQAVVLTCAAGSVRREIGPGSMVAIRDHINLTGLNPLVGVGGDASRSVDLTAAYDPHLRERFALAAGELGRKTMEGTFMWFPGPSFETPSEVHAARALGADLVGMSTAPEVVIARHLGLRVLALATVTNYAAGLSAEALGREQTMRVSAAATASITRVLMKFFDAWVLNADDFSDRRNRPFAIRT